MTDQRETESGTLLPPADTAHPAEAAIELRGVSISFGDKRVLSDVSLRVEKGGTLFLLGVTGSGKSVLLKLMVGLLKPDAGEILIGGQPIGSLAEEELNSIRKRMGLVLQEGALFDSLSVYENVAYLLRESGQEDEEQIEQRVREVLRFVEMEQAIDKMPAELSGGMRRRVSIARAIAGKPEIMLYDSPTAGLDPVTSHTINLLIAKLRDVEHVTCVIVTHRLQDAYVLTQYVFSKEKGELVPAGQDGVPGSAGSTQFLILRDAKVYFLGSKEEMVEAKDPYIQKFLA